MDLLAIRPNTIDLRIKHPGTGADTGLVLQIASRDSEQVKAVIRKHLDRRNQSRSHKKQTTEEMEAQNIELLAASVVGWRWEGDASWGGKQLEYSNENVMTVIATGWVWKQVQEEANSEADFFQS